jgi:4-amino-4-deoxy-L-arabinose transferase-like glycosyltransferase
MQTKTKIFLTLFLTYAFFTNSYLTTNDASRFSLTAAIVEEHSFEIDNFLDRVISDWWWAKDYASLNGHKYSDKAPLGSFIGVPIYFFTRLFTSDLRVLTYLVSLFSAGVLTAATSLLIYNMGSYFTENSAVKTTLALAYGVGTLAFFYATVFFAHAVTAFFGFFSFYLLFQFKKGERERKYLAFAGAASALAISSDYYAGVIALPLFFYALF